MTNGTLCYGDFFYDYEKGKILDEVAIRISIPKAIIFLTIAICSFGLPCAFNYKIKDNFVKFRIHETTSF